MRGVWALLLCLVALSGCIDAASTPPAAAARPYTFVVHGDSFTAALDPGQGDVEDASWATSARPELESVLHRLRSVRPDVQAANVAFSGARVRDIASQASNGPRDADLVLVFLGINDLCMQPDVEAFRADARTGLGLVATDHPDARVVVYAIPDLWRLHELHLAEPRALAFWSRIPDYCPEFFNPLPGPASALAAYGRLISFNEALAAEAARNGFTFSEATLWPGWDLGDFSDVDYFHPDPSGERRLAAAAWTALAG